MYLHFRSFSFFFHDSEVSGGVLLSWLVFFLFIDVWYDIRLVLLRNHIKGLGIFYNNIMIIIIIIII